MDEKTIVELLKNALVETGAYTAVFVPSDVGVRAGKNTVLVIDGDGNATKIQLKFTAQDSGESD